MFENIYTEIHYFNNNKKQIGCQTKTTDFNANQTSIFRSFILFTEFILILCLNPFHKKHTTQTSINWYFIWKSIKQNILIRNVFQFWYWIRFNVLIVDSKTYFDLLFKTWFIDNKLFSINYGSLESVLSQIKYKILVFVMVFVMLCSKLKHFWEGSPMNFKTLFNSIHIELNLLSKHIFLNWKNEFSFKVITIFMSITNELFIKKQKLIKH